MANVSIDPSELSAPSSPSASSCTHEDIDPTHSAGPSRKRVRTQCTTSEERKEARAHRNRVAAQNSRDRRKAQFSYLERRVAQLEEENRLLRAGAGIPPAEHSVFVPPISQFSQLEEDRARDEQDRARERENEELKERVRTLEKGWDIVLKALAAQGLPTGLSSSSPSAPKPATTNVTPNDTKSSLSTAEPSTPIPTTSMTSGIPSFPSPAPSHSSLESESTQTTLADAMFVNPSSSCGSVHGTEAKDESRHTFTGFLGGPAAGGFTDSTDTAFSSHFLSSVSAGAPSQTARKLSISVTPTVGITNNSSETSRDDDDDKVMEALFREIVTSPCTTQHETAETCKVSLAGSDSPAGMMDGCGDETGSGLGFVEMGDRSVRAIEMQAREVKEAEDHTNFADEDTGICDYLAGEWMNAMDSETERMLDEMIGLVGGGGNSLPSTAEYSDIGVGLGLGMDLDMSTLSSWDIDAAECIGAH